VYIYKDFVPANSETATVKIQNSPEFHLKKRRREREHYEIRIYRANYEKVIEMSGAQYCVCVAFHWQFYSKRERKMEIKKLNL
jgi:hypothetical protein